MTLANLFALDSPDVLIILAIVLLLFGGTKLPQLARSLGAAKREFHEGAAGGDAGATTATSPALSEASPDDTVTITRAELDRLRAADHAAPTTDTEPK